MHLTAHTIADETHESARFLTPRRLRLYPFAMLAGVVIGFAVLLVTSAGLRTAIGGRIGGDFPGFYGAGQIVRQGGARTLYDPAAQRAAQRDLLPGAKGGWIHFAYPPGVALAYVPFTLLSFKTAYVVHSLLMALCCIGALAILRSVLPGLGPHFWTSAAAMLTFYPLFRANVGGQNTAVSLLCAAGCAAALANRRERVAGLWLGAWLFKPQLALPVVMLVAVRYPRVLVGFSAAGAAWYLVGALVAGPDWPTWWLRTGVYPFALADLAVDRGNGISLREVAAEYGVPAIGWLLVVVIGLYGLRHALRPVTHRIAYVGMAATAAVLVAPHALYYDGGLAVLGLAATADVLGAAFLPYLAGAWVAGGLQGLRPYLPIPPPLTIVLAAVLVAAGRAAARRTSATSDTLPAIDASRVNSNTREHRPNFD